MLCCIKFRYHIINCQWNLRKYDACEVAVPTGRKLRWLTPQPCGREFWHEWIMASVQVACQGSGFAFRGFGMVWTNLILPSLDFFKLLVRFSFFSDCIPELTVSCRGLVALAALAVVRNWAPKLWTSDLATTARSISCKFSKNVEGQRWSKTEKNPKQGRSKTSIMSHELTWIDLGEHAGRIYTGPSSTLVRSRLCNVFF